MKSRNRIQSIVYPAMPSKRLMIGRTVVPIGIGTLFLSIAPQAQAQAFNEWTGSGTEWSTTSNWTAGGVGNYGQLEFKGNGNASSNNSINPVGQWRVYFSGLTKSYTLTASNSGVLNLFDFGGAHSWILSDSAVKQTFSTLTVNFAATQGATFGQISARNTGELAFNNVGITGSQVAQLRIAGQNTGKVTFSGGISGSGKAVVIGIDEAGGSRTSTDVVFNGASTYNGDTFVNAGKLTLGLLGSLTSTIQLGDVTATGAAATFALGATAGGQSLNNTINVRTGSNGTKTLDSLNTSGANALTGAITLDADLTLKQAANGLLSTSTGGFNIKAQRLTVDAGSGGTVTISQALTSSLGAGGSLVKQGSGTLILSSNLNNYTGTNSGSLNSSGTQIAAGTLAIAADTSLGLAPAGAYNNVQFTGSGILRSDSNISLNSNRNISVANGATASFDSNGNTFTINGIVNGSGGNVDKIGAGTVIFAAANTYTGTTVVSTGTLVVNGSTAAASAVTVASGATLAGTGTIGGTLGISGNLAPGAAGVDIQTLDAGTTTWNGGSNLWNFDLGASAGSSDALIINGNFTKGTGGAYKFDFMGSAPAAWGNAYTLVTWTGTTNFMAGDFSFQNLGGSFTGVNNNFAIVGKSLVFTAVPEPTSALAGLLFVAGLLRRRRA